MLKTTQARRLLRQDIFSILRPLVPQTFLLGKVMHENSRLPGFVGTIDYIWATGKNSFLLSFLSFPPKYFVVFGTTNYVSFCVRWAFDRAPNWPIFQVTKFKLWDSKNQRQESAFDRLKSFSCVHQDLSKQTGQNYFFLILRHFVKESYIKHVL